MRSEWTEHKLEDCMEALIDYRGKSPKKSSSGIPLVTAKIIKGGRIETPAEFIPEIDYEGWMRRGIPRAGDVVMTTEAPLGEIAQLDGKKVALAQRVVTLRGKSGFMDNDFLKYLMLSEPIQQELRNRSSGTTVVGIRQSELRKVPLPVPPLAEQHEIAAILRSIDDKIANNRVLAADLEAMARAIFKSWFVDFDPVKAKMDGRAPAGMDADAAALFPDALVESDLGLIPEGWEVGFLTDAFELNPRCTLKKGTPAPYLEMSKVPVRGHVPDESVLRAFTSGTKFQNGDTLLARITPCLENGKTAHVDFLDDDHLGWGSTEFIVLRSKPPIPAYFGYLLCRHEAFREYAISSMTGTSGRQGVQPDSLARWQLALPTESVCKSFAQTIDPLRARIRQLGDESRELAQLRNTLLPRLISGKLRIPNMPKAPSK